MYTHYVETLKGIVERDEQLRLALSDIDKDINDCNHVIEYVKLNAVHLSKFIKLYKLLLITRRNIKEERYQYTNVLTKNGKDFYDKIDEYAGRGEERNKKYESESRDSHRRILSKYVDYI
jgi:hypothetical protein